CPDAATRRTTTRPLWKALAGLPAPLLAQHELCGGADDGRGLYAGPAQLDAEAAVRPGVHWPRRKRDVVGRGRDPVAVPGPRHHLCDHTRDPDLGPAGRGDADADRPAAPPADAGRGVLPDQPARRADRAD